MNKLLRLYKLVSIEATHTMLRNWLIIPAMFLAFVCWVVLANAVAPLGLAGGFIIGMTGIALLALYYSWVLRTLDRERLNLKNLYEFDVPLFFRLISVAFIFWIVFDLLLGSFTAGVKDNTVKLCAQLAAFFMFNALPEVLYRHHEEGMQALKRSFEFTRDYYIEWFLPVVFLLCWPLLTVSLEQVPVILAGSQPLVPFKLIFDATENLNFGMASIGYVLAFILKVVAAHWFMLFRGVLFQKIEAGYLRRIDL